MTRFSKTALLAALASIALTACAQQRDASIAPPESRAKAVLDAQYAAEAQQPPMQAAEANKIYDAYIEEIGKKAKEQKSTPE